MQTAYVKHQPKSASQPVSQWE